MIDYNKILTKKVTSLKPSGIRKFFDIASEMKGVISLGVGEPDFNTPWAIRQAGIQSLEEGKTWYTSNAGLMELRSEICRFVKRRYDASYKTDEVLVTVGGSEAIDMCIRAFVDPGDEVIIPEPCYVSYDPVARLCGAVPVSVQTLAENEFRLTAEQLKAAITDKTKVLILPYPNNPTGAIMHRKDLEEIAEVLRGTDIIVLSDEIYSELCYSDEHVCFSTIEGMWERTVLINGFSKSFAMTGWRMGYACGPKEIISQMTKIHQFSIMCAPTMGQHAAIEALRNCDDAIADMRDEYDQRRRLILNGFRKMGFECFEPLGAFYIFPSIKHTGMSSEEFCEKLLYTKKIAIVPGTAFGDCGEGYIRVSYSYSTQHIIEALARIEEFVKENNF